MKSTASYDQPSGMCFGFIWFWSLFVFLARIVPSFFRWVSVYLQELLFDPPGHAALPSTVVHVSANLLVYVCPRAFGV